MHHFIFMMTIILNFKIQLIFNVCFYAQRILSWWSNAVRHFLPEVSGHVYVCYKVSILPLSTIFWLDFGIFFLVLLWRPLTSGKKCLTALLHQVKYVITVYLLQAAICRYCLAASGRNMSLLPSCFWQKYVITAELL
jgi:hypothetical protein